MTDRPLLRLNPGQGRRLRAGSPWVFSNEIAMKPEFRQMPRGGLVWLETEDGIRLTTSDPEFEAQMEVARGLMKKWHNVLRELAK